MRESGRAVQIRTVTQLLQGHHGLLLCILPLLSTEQCQLNGLEQLTLGTEPEDMNMCIYIYMHIYLCVYMYVFYLFIYLFMKNM